MKKLLLENIKIFAAIIITSIVATATTVFAYSLIASDVEFTPRDTNWAVDNVKDALDSLHRFIDYISSDLRYYLVDNEYNISLEDYFSSLNFCSDSDRLNNTINDSRYTNIILNSNNAIKALDSCNPIVSTNSSKAFCSSQYNSTWSAASAFGASGSGWGVAANLSYQNQYIGYDFDTPVWVYKMVAYVSDGKQNTDYVLEASNSKTSDYTIIKDGLHQTDRTVTVIPNNYNQKYRYYRIRFLSNIAQSGSGNTIVTYLRFYAK